MGPTERHLHMKSGAKTNFLSERKDISRTLCERVRSYMNKAALLRELALSTPQKVICSLSCRFILWTTKSTESKKRRPKCGDQLVYRKFYCSRSNQEEFNRRQNLTQKTPEPLLKTRKSSVRFDWK
eukprot:403365676